MVDVPNLPAHGTRRRYRLELDHDGQACPECSRANARYQRQYRAARHTVHVGRTPTTWDQLTLDV